MMRASKRPPQGLYSLLAGIAAAACSRTQARTFSITCTHSIPQMWMCAITCTHGARDLLRQRTAARTGPRLVRLRLKQHLVEHALHLHVRLVFARRRLELRRAAPPLSLCSRTTRGNEPGS